MKEPPPGVKKIVVADDNHSDLAVIQAWLEQEGFWVIPAKNGEEAMDKIMTLRPDLAILDVSMPKLDGDQVYMMLRSHEATKHIPILILTGLRSEEEIDDIHEENTFAKPVKFSKLIQRIRELIA